MLYLANQIRKQAGEAPDLLLDDPMTVGRWQGIMTAALAVENNEFFFLESPKKDVCDFLKEQIDSLSPTQLSPFTLLQELMMEYKDARDQDKRGPHLDAFSKLSIRDQNMVCVLLGLWGLDLEESMDAH